MVIMSNQVRPRKGLVHHAVASVLMVSFLLHGCAHRDAALLRPLVEDGTSVPLEEATPGSQAGTEAVRAVVVQHGQGLSADEKETILTTEPETGLYRMGPTLGEYYWSWRLSSGRTAAVRYLGHRDLPIDPRNVYLQITEQSGKGP